MDVPSTWVEERHEEYADDYGFGTRSYVIGEPESEDFGRIDIYYSEALQNETPEGYIESIYGSGMNYEMEDGPVIDGVQTRICRYTFEKPTTQWVDVFIYGPEMHYRISLYGELVEVERILDTIELG